MSWTNYQDDRAASYASGMIEQYHMQFDYMRSTIHGLLKPLGKAAVAVFCTPVWLAQHDVSMSYHVPSKCALSLHLLFCQSMYQWAVTVVGSRAMHLQGERYLVPMADMFNYKPAAVRGSAPCVVAQLCAVGSTHEHSTAFV